MAEYCVNSFYKVLISCGHSRDSLTASVLCGIGIRRKSLDISCLRHCDDTVMLLDKVFKVDIVKSLLDIGASLVVIFFLYLKHLFLDDGDYLCLVCKDTLKLLDKCVESIQLIFYLLSFHTSKTSESHFNDCLCLDIGKSESIHQGDLGCIDRLTCLHYLYDLVDIIVCDLISLKDMCSRLCFFKIKLSAAANYRLLMLDIVIKYLRKVKYLRLLSYDG